MTEESKYIRFDWAIKRILRDKANKEVLEGLIHVLIGQPVTITEILESENNKDRLEDKGNRVDVKAQTEKGEIIIVGHFVNNMRTRTVSSSMTKSFIN